MIGLSIKRAIAPVLFLTAAGFLVVRYLLGCMPAEQNAVVLSAENAAAVAQYDKALLECKKAARKLPKAERFDAYETCERDLSKQLCADSQDLRREWKRCTDVGLGEE